MVQLLKRKIIHPLKSRFRALEAKFLDFKLGINTSYPGITGANLVTSSSNKANATAYSAVPYRNLRILINEAGKRGYKDCAFYDLGSGIGRACFFAAQTRQFKSVVGLEFSRPLVTLANKNLEVFKGPRELVSFVEGDAAEYTIGTKRNLVFMYNPFNGIVLEKFISNNKAVLDNSMIAYCNDFQRDVLESNGWTCVFSDPIWRLSLWKTRTAVPPSGALPAR